MLEAEEFSNEDKIWENCELSVPSGKRTWKLQRDCVVPAVSGSFGLNGALRVVETWHGSHRLLPFQFAGTWDGMGRP